HQFLAVYRHDPQLLLRNEAARRGRDCGAKDVEFSSTGPGLAVDLGQGDQAHIAPGCGREAHRFLGAVRGEGARRYRAAPGGAIGADVELVARYRAVRGAILAGQIAPTIDLILAA